MSTSTIAFIGAGHLAGSLIQGLINDHFSAENIWVSAPNQQQLDTLHNEFGINITTDNANACKHSNIIIIAVKPQQVQIVCQDINGVDFQQKPLIISVAAGITIDNLEGWLNNNYAILRAMPNTPCAVNAGAIGLFANKNVTSQQQADMEILFNRLGACAWLTEESQLDALTALIGGGPAHVYYFIEALENATTQLGLNKEVMAPLIKQTVLGATQLALQTDDISALRKAVSTPGGTTEQAIHVYQQQDLLQMVQEALQKSTQRAIEISGKEQ